VLLGLPSSFRALISLAALTLAACVPSDYPAWRFAHANGANTGIVFVATAPAGAGSISVPNIGTFAPGAGPVVDSEGTVYIGNEQGRLMAVRENGASIWNVAVSGGEPIVGSPLITSGVVFVVAATNTAAALYKFDADGQELFRSPFPIHRDLIATTTPNVLLWWSGDAIVVPATYRLRAAPVFETRVIAFAAGQGEVLHDQLINIFTASTTGGVDDIPGVLDNPPLKLPLPMAATFTDLTDGQPRMIVADGYQAVVAYKVVNGSLLESRRFTDTEFRSFTSTPTVMYDRNSGRYRGFLVNRASGFMWADDPLSSTVQYTQPNTHTASSVTLTTWANLAVWNNALIALKAGSTDRIPIAGNSAASVAASQNYFYVSSVDAFTTFEIVHQQQVARFDWVGGGLHPPVIGPKGHVYAIASNILFIFPPPRATAMMTSGPLVQDPLERSFAHADRVSHRGSRFEGRIISVQKN
jgi:hypothetical protein